MPKKSNINKLFKHLSNTKPTIEKTIIKTKESKETKNNTKKAENEQKP
jgi:hypothetical protein